MITAIATALIAALAMGGAAAPESEGIGKARQLLFDQQGWKVYRARNVEFHSCFAYKVAEGSQEPAASGAGMALGQISGAPGLKLYISDDSDQYEYGLFGEGFYTGRALLEAGGNIWSAVYSFGDLQLPDLLALDGQTANVEIASYRYRSRVGPRMYFTGQIDLSGLSDAYAALESCNHSAPSL